jgi:hypothetical protein
MKKEIRNMSDDPLPTSENLPAGRSLRSPVFIVGSPRSGTTILAEALREVGYFGFNEGHLLSLLMPIRKLINQHFTECDAHDDAQLLSNVDREEFTQNIFDVFRLHEQRYNSYEPWFDKTPDAAMIHAAPFICRLWPDAAFIFAKRRAIENVASRMKKFPETTFEDHCKYWAETMAAWRAVRDEGISYIEIDQYDIAHHPEESGAQIGSFLGLSRHSIENMTTKMTNSRPQRTNAYGMSQISSIENFGWSLEQIETLRANCTAEMEFYSYTFDERYRK